MEASKHYQDSRNYQNSPGNLGACQAVADVTALEAIKNRMDAVINENTRTAEMLSRVETRLGICVLPVPGKDSCSAPSQPGHIPDMNDKLDSLLGIADRMLRSALRLTEAI